METFDYKKSIIIVCLIVISLMSFYIGWLNAEVDKLENTLNSVETITDDILGGLNDV